MSPRAHDRIAEAGVAELERMRKIRRRLHHEPEVGLDLPVAQKEILANLEGLGLEVSTGESLSSVTAVLRGGAGANAVGADSAPVVLLRADMDALPIVEETGLPYASKNGAMHACGHDLHVAGLIGAARILAARREEIPGTVVFMFQPGEEGLGGGRMMIDEGILDVADRRPVAAFAIHVDGRTPLGRFTTRPGPIMAGVNGMRIRIRGTGGHAAAPHLAIDPVPVSAEVILAIQSFRARRIAAHDPVVISIGRITSDSAAGNVLASQIDLEANVRHFSDAARVLVRDELPQMVRGIAEAHGCEADIEFVPSYPATVNDVTETERAMEWMRSTVGDENVLEMTEPAMASEDFAYVLEQVPGTLVFLGAKPDEVATDDASGMHSATVIFDDEVLGLQAATLAGLAWMRLDEETKRRREGGER
ncbi:M20 metallopeptidase family protein [Brevibacterium sp. FME17]|uniref:M20 metallopeptidase family protein n=1 Tax=Brevibacterium sp. FME17 TaxID=2742606 RepID=UPI00186695F0|nr:M20 family metallopeptidase [Brevibacterium sp. FME17]